MAKKEATTAAQFELLVTEMEKHPDVARGTSNFGGSKARVDRVWDATSKLLNAIGPPIRTPSKWRKVWTDYRGRLEKKLSHNKPSICQTVAGPKEYCEITPTDQTSNNTVNTNVSVNQSEIVYGLKAENTKLIPPKTIQASSLAAESSVSPTEYCQQPQMSSSSPAQEPPIVGENELYASVTLSNEQLCSKKQTSNVKKRRQDAKDKERKKILKLTERQTEEMAKWTIALEKLTTAIETQTKVLQEKLK